jgi:hypothetical protein
MEKLQPHGSEFLRAIDNNFSNRKLWLLVSTGAATQ